MKNIAVLGYGTVGTGVIEVINTNGKVIKDRQGVELNVKYVLDLRDFPNDPIQEKIVHDYDIILNDEEVSIVIEVMGGVEPAYTFAKSALKAGKSVISSNKALVAAKGTELLDIAKQNNVNFLFEASCGGGIPIIRPLSTSITADEVMEITGILNGTTNYMLHQMNTEGVEFSEALVDAQSLGYAEADPTADIEGHDTCRKLAILTSVATGKYVDFEEIYTEGITKVSAIDMKYAKKLGYSIKLLGTSHRLGEKFCAMVAPFLVSPDSSLYSIVDVFNGILVKGNVLGEAMFYGSGAGKLPTASAVVTDIIEAAKNEGNNIFDGWRNEKLELIPIDDVSQTFYVRVKAGLEDRKSIITELFGDVEFVILDGEDNEFAFITETVTESKFRNIVDKVENVESVIRVK
jgi:Homoserine dehydrogenase